jgi:hypothetical protein
MTYTCNNTGYKFSFKCTNTNCYANNDTKDSGCIFNCGELTNSDIANHLGIPEKGISIQIKLGQLVSASYIKFSRRREGKAYFSKGCKHCGIPSDKDCVRLDLCKIRLTTITRLFKNSPFDSWGANEKYNLSKNESKTLQDVFSIEVNVLNPLWKPKEKTGNN